MIKRRTQDSDSIVATTVPPATAPPTNGNGNGTPARLRSLVGELTSILTGRWNFASQLGQTFGGSRNLYAQLGYTDLLAFPYYLARYQRGGIAKRLVECYPRATWSSGARIVEDPDPATETPFEEAVRDLFDRLDVWTKFVRADVIASLGEYSVIVIGAPGEPSSPLPDSLRAEDIRYLRVLSEQHARIETYVEDTDDPRFGLPATYKVSFVANTVTIDKTVHWSRIIHVADGALEDDLKGAPVLRAVWNYLDDLDKVVGGGAEAAWKRMDPGMQVDIDPTLELDEGEEAALSAEIDEFQHGLRRVMRTRGTKMNLLSTTVAGFGPNVEAITQLIAATHGVPHRIFMGSERGELASSQDRLNWNDRISERRRHFGTPLVRQFLERLIVSGAIPPPAEFNEPPKLESLKGRVTSVRVACRMTPKLRVLSHTLDLGGYSIVWPEIGDIDNKTKADVIAKLTASNQSQKAAGLKPIATSAEIRHIVLDLGPLSDEDIENDEIELPAQDDSGRNIDPDNPRAVAQRSVENDSAGENE